MRLYIDQKDFEKKNKDLAKDYSKKFELPKEIEVVKMIIYLLENVRWSRYGDINNLETDRVKEISKDTNYRMRMILRFRILQ